MPTDKPLAVLHLAASSVWLSAFRDGDKSAIQIATPHDTCAIDPVELRAMAAWIAAVQLLIDPDAPSRGALDALVRIARTMAREEVAREVRDEALRVKKEFTGVAGVSAAVGALLRLANNIEARTEAER